MKIFYTSWVFMILITVHLVAREAFVIVPGTDLVSCPLSASILPQDLPYQEGTTPLGARLHQLLFNERVYVIKNENNYACIRVQSAFYGTANKTLKNEYWVLSEHLEFIDSLKEKKIPLSLLPPENNQNSLSITLHKPWYNPANKLTYYPGTRFKLSEEQPDSALYYCLYYDSEKKAIARASIERDKCRLDAVYTPTEARNFFVSVLRTLAQTQPKIPYIWGGSGYKGYDCAGLIYRTARLAGIPLFLKNSSAMAYYLKPVQSLKKLKEGDIIWLPGHVLVVASLAKNTIIEARCYGHGYGCVHEASLQEVFGIKSFSNLWDLLEQKKPLKRLAKNGSILTHVPTFKLLQLESAWHVAPPL